MTLVGRIRGALKDPNPIVRKELLTLLRTPVYVRFLFVALIFMGLVVIGAAVSADEGGNADTSGTGRTLFQIFFSLDTLFVVIMGATLASVSITLERENRTLDALRLSALGPRRIVMGKLVAVFLATAFVPASLLPMLGVVFLFGGVSIAHIAVAGLYSLALGALGIAAGTAISARARTTRRALLATVPAVVMATFMLGAMLTGLSESLRRSSSSGVFSGPFFFADSYLALAMDVRYAVGLLLLPVYLFGTGLWLAYAVAFGGLMDDTEDRALPIKRWALFALGAGLLCTVAFANAFKGTSAQRNVAAVFVQIVVTLVGLALAAAFAGESLVPSARVNTRRGGALSTLLLPPGLSSSVAFVSAVILVTALLGPVVAHAGLGTPSWILLLTGAWCGAYVSAVASGAGFVAAQTGRPAAGRAVLVVGLLFTWVLVWLAEMLWGHAPTVDDPGLLVTLSPVWVASAAVRATDLLARGTLVGINRSLLVQRLATSAGVYALAAIAFAGLLWNARRRATTVVAPVTGGSAA